MLSNFFEITLQNKMQNFMTKNNRLGYKKGKAKQQQYK